MAPVNNFTPKISNNYQTGSRFSDILSQKKLISSSDINNFFTHILSNHQASAQAINTSLIRKDYTPQKLLESQFTISMFLLREQMYTKTAELSANTLKNFTQMQV